MSTQNDCSEAVIRRVIRKTFSRNCGQIPEKLATKESSFPGKLKAKNTAKSSSSNFQKLVHWLSWILCGIQSLEQILSETYVTDISNYRSVNSPGHQTSPGFDRFLQVSQVFRFYSSTAYRVLQNNFLIWKLFHRVAKEYF